MNSLVAPPFETLVWLGRNPRQSYYVRELCEGSLDQYRRCKRPAPDA